ncbi:protein SIEVE ELEMENT OCCLUSION B-like [Gossypium australe]|uniref:Protein SIEVE ELEMENT OCCLUSION B-like n=1 Tax=Gossypium australe TaxID=47621 RepID=A0A5B6V627_9ROSI|nr:protein SIEVE ELEMENT OCCLUSION B-like [Gossypium australe]
MAAEAKTSPASRSYSFDKLSQQTQMTNKTISLQTLEPDVGQHLLDLIQSIFQIVVASKDTDQSAELDNMISSLETFQGMRQVLNDIRDISCELSCNLLAAGSGNLEKTRIAVLERLRSYSWSAKVVIAIAAFASSIGELSMLVKHRDDDSMAKFLVNILKGHSLKLDFKALAEAGLIESMLEVVRTNLDFSNRLKQESMKETMLELYLDATKNIFEIVLKISTVLSKREDVDVELKSFSTQLKDISIHLQHNMKYIGAKKISPLEYEEVSKISTSELIAQIKKCIEEEDSEKLRNKHVLFLISDLDISIEEIKVLKRLYEKNEGKYEIVWLPIVGSAYDYKAEARFLELRQMMKWIAVEPSRIKEFIQYIKRDWHFIKEAIAVSVNEVGEITCLNALPMLWTWGNGAFPFTDKITLWNELDERKTWRLDLLFDQLILPGDSDIDIESWTKSEATLVCLFGGGDISWNQEFIQKVNNAALSAGVILKLVYLGVGKNKGKGLTRNQLGRDILVIQSESQWQFWSRLESILYAKIRLGKKDEVMQEALKVVGYGGNGEEWAMFSMGQGAMVTTSGKTALTIMEHYQQMERSGMIGVRFLEGIKNYKKLITRDVHSCIDLHLPAMGQIPGIMICPECSKVMDVFYTYRCCPE